ncbi:MAG: hypothetical protein IPK26_00355 [Planctomycetes bacterium]|nr:hypothetical protein [Planctomycetota bacterium]
MHMAYYEFLYSLMLLLGGIVGLPMPLAVPPAPDEPALTRVVPKDAIAYLAWNGIAAADPKSNNLTERLAAEPEIRAMVIRLRDAFGEMVAAEDHALAQRAVTTILAALQQPGCVFVRRFARQPRPVLEAGIVCKLRDPALRATARELFAGIQELAARNRGPQPAHDDVVVDGVTFTSLGTDTEHSFVGFAEIDDWLALAIGNEMPAQIVAGLRKNDPGIELHPGHANLMPACQVARPSTKAFLDLQGLRTTIGALGAPLENYDLALAALGLAGATAITSQTGLEGTGFCQRVRLATPAHDGVFGALSGAPLSQDELAHIPLDAQIAISTRVDAVKLEASLLRFWGAFTGMGDAVNQEYEREFVEGFPKHVDGVRFREDLLAHLGDQFTIWNSPGQGGLGITGASAVWPLRDGKAFGTAFGKLMAFVERNVPPKAAARERGTKPRRNGEFLETFSHAGHHVWWLDILDDDMVIAPAWSIAGNRLVGGLLPQSMRATLSALPPNPDQSLIKLPALNKRGAATGLLCWNAKDVVALGYPALLLVLKSAEYEWLRDGFDFDVADLPQPGTLLPHLGREVILWEPTDKGYAWTRNGTLPVFDPLAIGLLSGLMVVTRSM